ncbi:MAG: (Fe-S)-binding protein, partial [Pseudolabrys sp.]
ARLLFEMMRGETIELWKSREVEEALDLCLGCKGCKSDCPVHVDMATYKAEFRAQHYRGRLRPRAAYSMGLIHRWSEYAARLPGLVNLAAGSSLGKWAAGIASQRSVPPYARRTFRSWFQTRGKERDMERGKERNMAGGNGRRVMLWPDTFNNYFRPQTAIAATQVLESLGYEVTIPQRVLCCGRPLYDWGRLDEAKALWRETMQTLATEIASGTPIIGLEPACVSAFRDELVDLFPDNQQAQQLSRQTSFFTEFLERHEGDLPAVGGGALVQLHCHHHAVIKPDAEKAVLKRLGVNYEIMASGCCGMAGAFGFEKDKYEVSMKAAERVLLPKVRAAAGDTLILANGFSCREQIEQGSARKTRHIADIIAERIGATQPQP